MSPNNQHIRKFLLGDLSAALIIILIATCYAGLIGVKSACLAGITYLIPNAVRTIKSFRYHGAQASRKILKSLYQGEMLKFGLSLVLFALVFAKCTVNPFWFFGAYFAMQVLTWLTPLLNRV